ncbi:MAG: hypothetical protein C0467_20245 [Planctomycetaceae bacterium]|nr:hypothetical protein [Planctomycetaceae bacterium]
MVLFVFERRDIRATNFIVHDRPGVRGDRELLTRSHLKRIEMTAGCRDAEPIPKVPEAGTVASHRGLRCQSMHNGVRVMADAYCGAWMTELIGRLRGHHEPQEEKVFHNILHHFRPDSVMLELGCGWAYYSLWFRQAVPGARLVLVEPDPTHLNTARRHFEINDAQGEFLQASIGEYSTGPRPFFCESDATTRSVPRLSVDDLVDRLRLPRVEVLHADIQGAELDMLRGAVRSIDSGRVRFLFLSTHDQFISGDSSIHEKCVAFVKDHGGHLIACHSIAESYSGDGLVVASFDPSDRRIPEVPVSRNHPITGWHELDFDLAEAGRDADVLTAGRESRLMDSDEVKDQPFTGPHLKLFTGEGSSAAEIARSEPYWEQETRPVTGPMVSYSMNREDVLLQRVFADQATGFYVDVGANSPHRFSNTKHFYDRGWRGINVEPSRVFDELAAHRPRDINLRLAASDANGTVEFHECDDTSLSSVPDRQLPEGFVVAAPKVIPARTLASVFEEHANGPIDFMSVDVEGYELAVLRGNDWKRFRPRVLVVEATELLSHTAAHQSWEQVVLEADYLFAHFDGINRFYVRKEDSALLGHFAFPPTCLEFLSAEAVELRHRLDEAERRFRHQVSETERAFARSGQLTVWFDLTTLVVYPGNNTGIPRVVTKVLEALPLVPQVRTRLCVYDYHRQCFVKVSHKLTRFGRLRAWAKESLLRVIRPVRQACGQLKRAIGCHLSTPLRALRDWLKTVPGATQAYGCVRLLTLCLLHAVRPIALAPGVLTKFLRDLSRGIRQPHHPDINCRPFLFPICLFIHHILTQLPAAAALRRLGERTRMRQWFRLHVGDGTWVRATAEPVKLSPHDAVVQVGWHPHLRGIADAKKRQGFCYVSLVHDLIPVKLPHFVARGFPQEFAAVTTEQLRLSDLILANSECTLRDLEEFAREQSAHMPPAHVLRFGSEVHCLPRQSTASPVGGVTQGEPFVLYVSTIDPRKNHHTLYLVWRKLVQEYGGQVPKLVVVGSPNVHQLLHEIQFDPLVRGKILHRHPIDDLQLDWLYQNCLFTVYPSYYEGWGLPVSESLWYGKLCVAAGNSSIPEIGGDLVDYHDPYDLSECHSLIRRAAFDATYRQRREQEIAASYRPTTWRECAESLCRAIHRRATMSWRGRAYPGSGPADSVVSLNKAA